MKSRKFFSFFPKVKFEKEKRATSGKKGAVLTNEGLKSVVALVSYRLAVSERTLPIQIPLNPCSVAAECVVPPGETLPEGLITGHPVCAKAR